MIDDFIKQIQKPKEIDEEEQKEINRENPRKIKKELVEQIVVKLEALKETLNLNKNGPLPFEKQLISLDRHTHGAKHICV